MAGVAQRELITKTNLVAVPSSVFGGSDQGRSARASTAAASARSGRGTAKGKPKAPKFESRKTVEGVSTVAKQRRRQHEQLVADLAQARLERQKLHQGVLTLRLKSRREQLERMTNRYHQLIEENRELKREIECIERSVMDRVHNDLNRTVSTKLGAQTLLRQYQRDAAVAMARRDRAAARRDAAQREYDDALAELDEEALREATALKELLVYQQTGRFEDQRYKMRLEARLEDMLRSHQAEYDRVIEELEEARKAYQTYWAEREETVLSKTTDATLDAMSPRLHATTAENVELRAAIAQAEAEHADRTARVGELSRAVEAAKARRSKGVAAPNAVGMERAAKANLPSRAGKPLSLTAMATMASLADDLGFG
eukprot:m.15832 g.15832  ORF g.15832 m.15832 type:complete len:372 (+) comp4970_c0_seq1:389-1504(+)